MPLAGPLVFPLGGPPAVPEVDLITAEDQFYGDDIWYDVATADSTGQAGYVVTAAGDWAVATGIEALRQSLQRRIITNPGEWETLQSFGVGAPQYVKAPNTSANRAELEARIRSQFMQDDRVESITSVAIEDVTDNNGSPFGIKITVFVVAAGRLRQDAPIPVQLEVH